jgi:type VI secretion system protein ImpG
MFSESNPNFSRFLPYYQREMAYLLGAGQDFARAYPAAAQGLDLSAKGSSDPHVQRLIESFAFLTARLQLEIEDQYSFLSYALLSVLYPQFISPTPSCVMVKMDVPDAHKAQLAGTEIKVGSDLTSTSNTGVKCRFQTTAPATYWPLDIIDVAYDNATNYDMPIPVKSSTLLRLRIRSSYGNIKKFSINSLRFYLGGNLLTALILFKWLHTYDVSEPLPAMIQNVSDGPLTLLPRQTFQSLGFSPEEALVKNMIKADPVHQLLWEYFTFPQKFLFFQLNDLLDSLTQVDGNEFTLFLPLPAEASPNSCPLIQQNIQLNCVPSINLFRKTAEPIRFDYKKTRYRLVPDQRLEREMEVHSVLKVSSAVDMTAPAQEYKPYFSSHYHDQSHSQSCFWLGQRTRTSLPDAGGTDFLMSFIDYHMNAQNPAEKTIYAHTLCTNRKFAEKIPVQTQMTFSGDNVGITGMTLDRPTRSLSPILDGEIHWKLINQLASDFLGLCSTAGTIDPLKGILGLYQRAPSQISSTVDALQGFSIENTIGRLTSGIWRGFVPMLRVTMNVRENQANMQGYFLLVMILNEFFKLSGNFNTLIQTQIFGSTNNLIKRWEPALCTAASL